MTTAHEANLLAQFIGAKDDEIRKLQKISADLLALLKEAADWIESAADEGDDAAGATTFAVNIRAVIAKAEGTS